MGLQISMVMAKAIIQNEEFYFSKKVNPGRIKSVNVIKTHLRILKLSTNIKRTEEILFSLDIVFVHFIDLISLCINGKKKNYFWFGPITEKSERFLVQWFPLLTQIICTGNFQA